MSSTPISSERSLSPITLSDAQFKNLQELISYAEKVSQYGETLLKTTGLPSFIKKQAFEQMVFQIDNSKREIAHLLDSSLPEIQRFNALFYSIHTQYFQMEIFIERPFSRWTPDERRRGSSTPSFLSLATQDIEALPYPKKIIDLLRKLSNLMAIIDDYNTQHKIYQSELSSDIVSLLESTTSETLLKEINDLPDSVRKQIYNLIGEQHLRSNSSSLARARSYGKSHYLDKSQRQILKTVLFQISCRIKNKYKTKKRSHSSAI